MAKHIKKGNQEKVETHGAIMQKVFAITQSKHQLMGDMIPSEVGAYWRIGQVLAWHTQDMLENLALELRRSGKSWRTRDLAKMIRLYHRYPTVEILSGRCLGRKREMNLDELLNVE